MTDPVEQAAQVAAEAIYTHHDGGVPWADISPEGHAAYLAEGRIVAQALADAGLLARPEDPS